MYAIILCSGCGNPRMIDLGSTSSKCPRCGRGMEHHRAKAHLTSEDQGELRAAMWSLTGGTDSNGATGEIGPGSGPDRISRREIERISDPETRLSMVLKMVDEDDTGFTLDDLKGIFDEDADAVLRGMLDLGMVYEPRRGRYQRI